MRGYFEVSLPPAFECIGYQNTCIYAVNIGVEIEIGFAACTLPACLPSSSLQSPVHSFFPSRTRFRAYTSCKMIRRWGHRRTKHHRQIFVAHILSQLGIVGWMSLPGLLEGNVPNLPVLWSVNGLGEEINDK